MKLKRNFCPVGSTSVLFRRENTEHWPYVASLTGEHHPCATLNGTAYYISPTRTPSAFCQPGFPAAIFRSVNTNVHPRAVQLSTEMYMSNLPSCLQRGEEQCCSPSSTCRAARGEGLAHHLCLQQEGFQLLSS